MEFFPSKKSNNRGSLFSCPCAVLGFDFAILLPIAWPYLGSAWLSLAMSIGHWTGACWAFTIEPIKLSFILNGVCSPSKVNYCSNLFEVFIKIWWISAQSTNLPLWWPCMKKREANKGCEDCWSREGGSEKETCVHIPHKCVCVFFGWVRLDSILGCSNWNFQNSNLCKSMII